MAEALLVMDVQNGILDRFDVPDSYLRVSRLSRGSERGLRRRAGNTGPAEHPAVGVASDLPIAALAHGIAEPRTIRLVAASIG